MSPNYKTFKDMLGNEIVINHPPKRIITLVPSQTELLYDLGLEKEVVGITKFCVHPQSWFRNKKRVGGTKNVSLNIIEQLNPDLVIANKEENTKADLENILQLKKPLISVYVSNIQNLGDALHMIQDIGAITGKEDRAQIISQKIKDNFKALPQAQPLKVAYFIWRNPWMCAGGDTFIHDMITRNSWHNVFTEKMRYPQITEEDILASGAELILLSSEPYPFKEIHLAELQQLLPKAKILLVDGEMFSWYGSRLVLAPEYFMELHNKIII